MSYHHLGATTAVLAELDRYTTPFDTADGPIRREIENIDAVLANVTDCEERVRRDLAAAHAEADDVLAKLAAKRAVYQTRREHFTAALDRVTP